MPLKSLNVTHRLHDRQISGNKRKHSHYIKAYAAASVVVNNIQHRRRIALEQGNKALYSRLGWSEVIARAMRNKQLLKT